MSEALYPALINFLAVSVGLYVLWSLVSRMPAEGRAVWAITAGAISALFTFVITALVQTGA